MGLGHGWGPPAGGRRPVRDRLGLRAAVRLAGPRRQAALATADSIALGHHPEREPIVAVACDGQVRLWTVPGGEPIEIGAGAATVVDAVALGRVGSRDVLVTGSKGGVLGVWGLAPAERVAVLTLDDRITDVRVRLDSAVLALAGGRAFAVELVAAPPGPVGGRAPSFAAGAHRRPLSPWFTAR